MVNVCKSLCFKNNISYKQALKDASPSYKTRNETIAEPEVKATTETAKPKRKYNIRINQLYKIKYHNIIYL